MKHAMGGVGGGKDNQRAWFCTLGGGDEAEHASVPWGGRNPEAQPAGLGLQTCCFGDHPDTHGLKWTVQLGGAPLPATHYHSAAECAGAGWTAGSGPGIAS